MIRFLLILFLALVTPAAIVMGCWFLGLSAVVSGALASFWGLVFLTCLYRTDALIPRARVRR